MKRGCARAVGCASLLTFSSLAGPVWAGDATVVGTATASAPSSHWIAVEAPLSGDDNTNGYTTYRLGTSAGGPFSALGAWHSALPGPGEWRANVFAQGSVLPSTTYFVEVTYVDPDGVVGANPQVIGPITTPAASPTAVTVGTATAQARDTEIFVSVPIRDDADVDSFGTIDVATSAAGPWTRKCGSTFDRNLPFHPKRCRIRSLTPATDYWVRVTILDDDGVSGPNPQILGPLRYAGLANLALGRPVSADPGWGCCPAPSQLVDGRIQNDAWFFGFAWTGGTSCWAGGCPPGFKQATIDLGSPTTFDRAVVWYHDPPSVPQVWKFQSSNDGTTFTDVHSETQPVCRAASLELPGAWSHPACGHDATFAATTARYLRFTFDDRTLFRGLHGWAVEIEVFQSDVNQPPDAVCRDVTTIADNQCLADASIDGGSSDPDGDGIILSQDPPGPYGLGDTVVTLTVEDDQGASASCQATVSVTDVDPPVVQCNSPPTIKPTEVPISFTATVTDNCAVEGVQISGYDCFMFTRTGKRVDKRSSCVIAIDGATITIVDSGGVGNRIRWEVTANDTSGNAVTQDCEFEVVTPRRDR